MNKWILITGSSRGIGRETALYLAENGYNIVLHCSKNTSRLDSLKEQIGTNYNATIQMVLGDHLVIKTEEGIEGIIYFNNINGDTFDLISKTKKRFLRGRYTGETYKIGNEVNITMINIDEFSGDIEFNLNYKRKNLASRGKVLTQKPNKK